MKAPDLVPSSILPRVIEVIGSGIEDDDILQSCLDIITFLTKLDNLSNAEVILIENVSTLLCVL